MNDVAVSNTPTDLEHPRLVLERKHRQVFAILNRASAEFNVPLPVLEAVAFAESHWNQVIPIVGPSEIPESYGVMGLRDDDWFGYSLREAAALIGASPDSLKEDTEANVRGGAALLAKLASNERRNGTIVDRQLSSWQIVVEKYEGIHDSRLAADYARRVFKLIHDGYNQLGIEIDARPYVDVPNIRGKEVLAPIGGYPSAIWVGPPPAGNYQSGRGGNAITFVIMHTTEGTVQAAIDWFLNSQSQVSAHYVVGEDGTIYQVVSDSDTAYHAGSFIYNEQAIGIEMEGYADGQGGDFSWQTQAQYGAIQTLISWLTSQYGIPVDRAHLIGHNQVPDTDCKSNYWGGCAKGPHHDPGAWWNWNTLMTGLQHPPQYSELLVQSSCPVYALPQAGAPNVTNVWAGQKYVTYDSYNGYDLIFLTGEEAAQPPHVPVGEYHWDAWLASTCASVDYNDPELFVSSVFPSLLNVRLDTQQDPPIAHTIDGKRYVGTGNSQSGFDGYTWYEYYLAWDSGARTGWSSGHYIFPLSNQTYNITGTVAVNGSGIPGVKITLSGSQQGFTSTDTFGNYSFSGLPGGVNYAVTPALAGYSFNPASASFNPLNSNQVGNFTASANNNYYTVIGQVTFNGSGLGGVTMILAGGASRHATTDSNGNYSFSATAGGVNYRVTPFLSGYAFNPSYLDFSPLNSNQTANFLAAPAVYSISGQVTTNGSVLQGVTITLSTGNEWSGSTTTDSGGNYAFNVLAGGQNYLVVPSLIGYSFNPTGHGFDPLNSNQVADFVASITMYTVSVSLSGSGAGTVTSSPAGLNCAPACSANFQSGTYVTLIPNAANGSTFAGWTGACSGVGQCNVLMGSSQSVNAIFNSTIGGNVTFVAGTVSTDAGNGISGFSGDGGAAAGAEFSKPMGIVEDSRGVLYIADFDNARVRAVNTSSVAITVAGVTMQPGTIETIVGTGIAGFSGDGGSPINAELWGPTGLALDVSGNLYVSDSDNVRVRVVNTQSQSIKVLGVNVAPGTIQTVAGIGVVGYSGDGGPATGAEIKYAQGVAIDAAGNLYIADWANQRIRNVDSQTGIISTIAGGGNGCSSQLDGLGDGCPAAQAMLEFPVGVAVDSLGNVFEADENSSRVRVIYENGSIAGLSNPQPGYIYTLIGAGSGCPQQTDSAGDGCLAVEAGPLYPLGLMVDQGGSLLIVDAIHQTIRRVDRGSGIITAVSGNGVAGYGGDGGSAAGAEFSFGSSGYTDSLTLDVGGNLYVADTSNNRVRVITATANPVSFVTTNVGQSTQPQSISVENTGNIALTISSIAVAGQNSSDFSQQNNCPIAPSSLKAGASCLISVTFTPTLTGLRASFLVVNSNAVNSPQVQVSLSGRGAIPGPIVSLSPGALAFGSQSIGIASAPQTETLSNVGTATLTVSNIAITAANSIDFAQSNTCPANLSVNSSCSIFITFTPSTTGNRIASLTINDNAPDSPETVSVSGVGQPAISSLAFNPSVIVGPGTSIGTTSLNGPAPTNGASIALSSDNSVVQIPPNVTVSAGLPTGTFTATVGAVSTQTVVTVIATYNGASKTSTITVNPTLPLNFSPSQLSWGKQALGSTSAAQRVTLTNNTGAVVTISSMAVSGTNSADFVQSATTCGKTLALNKSCTISITFTPAALGARSAMLTITDSASNSPQIVPLSGTGVLQVTLSAASFAFGNQTDGSASAPKTVMLTNNANTALSILSVATTGTNAPEFTVSSNACGSSVGGHSSCKISVTFAPVTPGAKTASLTITDSANNSPQSVSLTGTGIAPVSVAPSSLTFTAQTVGTTSSAKTVTIKNNLPTTLTMSGNTFTGANAVDFGQSATTCGVTLASGAKCTFSITFRPTAKGTRVAVLDVGDSANTSPQTVTLSGTGK